MPRKRTLSRTVPIAHGAVMPVEEMRRMAKVMWQTGAFTLDSLKSTLDVADATLRKWRKEDGWATYVELQDARALKVRAAVREVQLTKFPTHFQEALDRALKTQKMIDDHKQEYIEEGAIVATTKEGDPVYGSDSTTMKRIVEAETANQERLDELLGAGEFMTDKEEGATQHVQALNIQFLTQGPKT